jgi:tyrosine-protein phosphatase YwqE
MFFFKSKEIPLYEFFPLGFVDIHSHLLPGIDDGAVDLDTAIELIQKMSSYGIKNFITTPHILGDLYPNTPEIIREKLAIVKKELIKRNIIDVSIEAAAEYMLDEQFSILIEENKELLTLKDNLVLVEMSYLSPPINIFDILFQMQLKGYKPVLAHPERYNSYHRDYRIYQKLKNAGCLLQLNLLSLTENYGKEVQKTSHRLLKENMYDFVGSDAHNLNHLRGLQKISTKKNKILVDGLMLRNNAIFNN